MKDKQRYCIKIELEETYELFDTIESAFNYCKNNKNVLSISLVLANNTFYENGVLTYEDFSNTIEKEIAIGVIKI